MVAVGQKEKKEALRITQESQCFFAYYYFTILPSPPPRGRQGGGFYFTGIVIVSVISGFSIFCFLPFE